MKTIKIKKGAHATFIIEIKSTKHQTWQGVLTWVEEKKRSHFVAH